ncbi:glycosyltransferase family 2 protein [Acidobacteriota bacterium]
MDKAEEALVLSVLLVNYNDRVHLSHCLASLKGQMESFSHEIIVVDNDSSDGSQEFIRENYPDVRLICNSENVGFAQANNIGLRECAGKFILLLNTDTVVMPEAIDVLMKAIQSDPGFGAVGPALLLKEDKFQISFGRKVSFWPELLQKGFLNHFYRIWLKLSRRPRSVGWLSAACLLVKHQVLRDVGFFDANFFLYFEDIDLCVRIRNSGHNLLYHPQARVFHVGGATTSYLPLLSRFHYRKSQIYFYQKHNSKMAIFLLRSYLWLSFKLNLLSGYLRGATDLEERRKLIGLLREQ